MRLIVAVEGQSEEAFVKDVLVPHLAESGVFAAATIVGKLHAQRRGHARRGGGHFRHWLADLKRILGSDGTAHLRVSTMFDLYGLPRGFPDLSTHRADPDTARRCDALQQALASTVGDPRFIAYLQRHEFEALVLANLPALRELLDAEDDLTGLRKLASEIARAAPEDIDDGPQSAPSKRLQRHIPGYRKALHGPLATSATGLAALRACCPRFDAWVGQLEALGSST